MVRAVRCGAVVCGALVDSFICVKAAFLFSLTSVNACFSLSNQ